ncbi:FAD/NAD(P)-binding domain-containing protein [Aspergillus heteromorphus CBS 117.55]|uniref:FAD/NAD(P)-binding domain-containing protein n=1 Tax=Aspergillus heteromorphus CBS 117.55 TaxID=1448321 RepID=A0A317X0C6_9EURO|nr:FAD/NAD(P)-binding domain-containing protein [Aspergillus heteromorphus CBS 117.55]PWY92096.1 FAD/NAD(P)-binding domain-containing protein [Aspergillus heteromorphus CBS 117.55]
MRSFLLAGLAASSSVVGAAATAHAGHAVHAAHSSSTDSYDYIVVGGGPSGIITAERLVEANKKVLLLERGYGPTVATGANETLVWNNTLTNIDLPGLSADIGKLPQWDEYICTDTEGYAACVLGGGVTVNYMVFVHPPERDFDEGWPEGWKWDDVKAASERLYARNPGTIQPSADGKRYDQGLYTVLSNFFSNLGWTSVDMITQPNEKYQVYSHPAWNIKDEVRAGPVRTYLPLAETSDNFSLRYGTKVIRVLRSGSQVTGVEVENASGALENITLADSGRVILSSGALHTPRILFNSGIGPSAQIEIAEESGVTVPPKSEWLDLPVGVGLKDHPIFSIIVKTNGTYGLLDYAAIVNGTDTADIDLYAQGSGVLTEGKHRMIFFSSNNVDNQTRYYQGSCAPTDTDVVTITTYMTHGLTSSGVLGLNVEGETIFDVSPYLQTEGDREAATAFVQSLVNDITDPSTGFSLETYTNVSAIIGSLSAGMHYTTTTKLGTDDGRYNGTSVVDLNTKVYGMDNLFVVDGGIHPDLPTGNIQATIMVVAEAAVARILALE